MLAGFGLFGVVDQVPGECYVATRFFFISGIPKRVHGLRALLGLRR
jgi:hypothetical protein